MHLSLDEFCEVVKELKKSLAEKALAILWYFDQQQEGAQRSVGELAKVMDDHHIANVNSSRLRQQIRDTRWAIESQQRFSLKPGSRREIRAWLPENLDGMQPAMNHSTGYLPEPVWKNTRGYVEEVCRELNGCFRAGYYNAASVMLRRLFETLIIEVYEHLKRESEIRGGDGHYLMLSDLVDRACGEKGHAGLNLGRNSKTALKDVRQKGNLSAHSRRYLAHATDLTNIQTDVRAAVQELILLANLQKSK